MEKANQRIKILEHDLAKLAKQKCNDDDDDLDDSEAIQAELNELVRANTARQAKLDEYEKHKKWNVDNMFQVKEERTIINPSAGKKTYTATGFIQPNEEDVVAPPMAVADNTAESTATSTKAKSPKASTTKQQLPAKAPDADAGVMYSYPQFTEKYADIVEAFMKIRDMHGTQEFLTQNASVLLQENASNYLLLASLEDEMNGNRNAMKNTARQSQIITNIAELAKTLDTHPGNVIAPFFSKMERREHFEEFMLGVEAFQDKIIKRAVVKKQEMDAQELVKKDLKDVPQEERLGPGGLDPLEVIETLPDSLVKAFESRDVDQLKDALSQMEPADAEYYMKRCVDSGLWVANA
jgi:cell division cycle protein 37